MKSLLSYEESKKNLLIILKGENESVVYSTSLTSEDMIAQSYRILGEIPEMKEVSKGEFYTLLEDVYSTSTQVSSSSVLVEEMNQSAAELAEEIKPEELLDSDNDAPIIKLINAVIADSIKNNSSDIHLEPLSSTYRVRIRVDGRLRTLLTLPLRLIQPISTRLKVISGLDITERRRPQDGSAEVSLAGNPVNIRVATIPSTYGEKIVLRILEKKSNTNPQIVGMSSEMRVSLDKILSQPNGMFLVCGPTGSGKSTTLYSILSRLNNEENNIMTLEDPVEYQIDGITQTQINPKSGLTFATGLKSFLRQDPDIMMVGEIRDLETAEMAIQASLTGHQVFSTLHTNTSLGAISRLRDLGVESYLLSSSLLGVLSQRLVRCLCTDCKQLYTPTEEELMLLSRGNVEIKSALMSTIESSGIYKASGCESCSGTGYQGRTGVYDLLFIDDELKSLIHNDVSESEIRRQYDKSDGLHKSVVSLVVSGETSVEEFLKVLGVSCEVSL
mgnify:CR=1 FL=1